ncbi:hypothetical protein ACFWWT_27800 [Streptomyces sp. NPDC058676]|uniref:hypothetical protein n=1 Tax=unclassified Streptomyces TaxID=2593676 RepID=UPI00364D0BB8
MPRPHASTASRLPINPVAAQRVADVRLPVGSTEWLDDNGEADGFVEVHEHVGSRARI